MAISTRDILSTLRDRHDGPEWLFFPELRLGTGYALRCNGRKVLSEVESRIDAFAMNCYPSKRCQRVAYEIKMTRSDFIREIRQPLKRRPAMLLTNLFYFVAPDGVLAVEDIPAECGLLVVKDKPTGYTHCSLKETVPAPWRDTGPAPWHFVAALGRRIAETEQAVNAEDE